jgi:hypothetical protein
VKLKASSVDFLICGRPAAIFRYFSQSTILGSLSSVKSARFVRESAL